MSRFDNNHNNDTSHSPLQGKSIAILATNGFEESELLEPSKALEEAGAELTILSLKGGEIKSWKDGEWGQSVSVDETIDTAEVTDFDALMIPGGVINPDQLRNDERVVKFVTDFMQSGKPIAAICHGPQVLIETKMLKGRTLTSWPSLKTDLLNAGANWVDNEVVEDQQLVTSRKPQDIPAFNERIIQKFAQANAGVTPGLQQNRSAGSSQAFDAQA